MIIDIKKTSVAYICPHCGSSVLSVVGVFALSGDLIKLKCTCEHSEMTISYTNDDKIRLSVPCIVCPNPHNYVLSKEAFFEDDLFVFSCPYSGISTCFIGDKDKVYTALEEAIKELERLMREAGISEEAFASIRQYNSQNEISDPQIHDIVHFMLCELDAEGKIKCKCESNKDSLYDFDIYDDHIKIYCHTCGAEKIVPIGSVREAGDFIATEELELT